MILVHHSRKEIVEILYKKVHKTLKSTGFNISPTTETLQHDLCMTFSPKFEALVLYLSTPMHTGTLLQPTLTHVCHLNPPLG